MTDRESAETIVEDAVRLLVEAAHPLRVILFGSAAGGMAHEGSDLDLLVVLRELPSRPAEMVRLLRALRPLGVPIDVLVYSHEEVEEWGHLPGTVLYEALTDGKVLYEAA